MINKLFLTAFLGLFIVLVNAQISGKIDDRILQKFTSQEIASMPAEGLGSLDYWNFYLKNGFKVIDLNKTKAVDYELVFVEENNINPFDKQFTQDETKDSYYKIEGTEKFIILFCKKGVDYRYEHPEVFKFGY